MSHLKWDLSIFALFRKILTYKTILFISLSDLYFDSWFASGTNSYIYTYYFATKNEYFKIFITIKI